MTSENDNRAKRCEAAIRKYNDEWDDKSNLIDLLADARHWCDRNGLSFAELDRAAYAHYCAEANDPKSGAAKAGSRSEALADELLAAMDYLLEQTVDMDLKHGIELSEGEEDARAKALAVIAKARR